MSKNLFVSYAERMTMPRKSYSKGLLEEYEVRGTEDTLFGGRVVKRSKLTTFKPGQYLKGLKATDFALENIIAVGALDSLKECQLSDSKLGIIDSVESTLGTMVDVANREASEVNLNSEGE